MNVINMLGAVQTTNIVLYVVLGLMLVALLVLPMINRRKQANDFEAMVNNLSVGDKVMTTAGMIGTIKKINRKEDGATFILQTGENTAIEFSVAAIATVLSSVKPIPSTSKKKKEEAPKSEEKKDDSLEKEKKKEEKQAKKLK